METEGQTQNRQETEGERHRGKPGNSRGKDTREVTGEETERNTRVGNRETDSMKDIGTYKGRDRKMDSCKDIGMERGSDRKTDREMDRGGRAGGVYEAVEGGKSIYFITSMKTMPLISKP